MPKYNTKQRTILLDYLKSHADEELTAKQIAASVECGEISISAVYRNLSELESEGKIHRLAKSDSRTVYYRYTGADECKSHLHLSCSNCGKTFHMDVPATNEIIKSVEESADFEVDSGDTVLYGICKNCKIK